MLLPLLLAPLGLLLYVLIVRLDVGGELEVGRAVLMAEVHLLCSAEIAQSYSFSCEAQVM